MTQVCTVTDTPYVAESVNLFYAKQSICRFISNLPASSISPFACREIFTQQPVNFVFLCSKHAVIVAPNPLIAASVVQVIVCVRLLHVGYL